MITQRIEVYLSKHSPTKSIHMVQNDTGRMLSMEVIDETIPSGSTAKLYFLRPNESLYYSDCTISGNTAMCDVTQALTQCGAVHCTLTFYTSGKSISAYAFDILVEKNNSEGPLTPEERESLVNKMENNNPVGSGSFSMNRYPGSSVGRYSSTLNHNNKATGDYSHAEGRDTAAGGSYSHAEGRNTIAGDRSSLYSLHSEGEGNQSLGDYGSHSEGYSTIASGYYGSHSEGDNTRASEMASHAEGYYTIASGTASHAEGYYTTASGGGAHAEGKGNTTDRVVASGEGSHAEGMQTKADGNASHAEGYMCETHASASHAECNRGKVYSENGHAEGFKCEVGSSSDTTKSMANSGHAEGRETKALGYASHSEGRGTIAEGAEQHVQGRFNVKDTTSAFIIGNGTDDTHRSNAMKVAFDGTLTIGSVSITPAQLQALLNLL